jgi:transcriptional regulator with XRE-family HTH domain
VQRSDTAKIRVELRTRVPRAVDVLVGHNIRICRLQRRLSQTELGHRTGVTFQQIQKYENGKNRVGASRLSQIADVLRVPLSTLFDGSPQASHIAPEKSPQALLAKPHALRLVTAFHKIPKDQTRMAVLRLIEALGSDSSPARVEP